MALGSGVVAGIAAATISQPADGLLSKVNMEGAGGEGSMMVRLGRIAMETGFLKLCTQGLVARWIHVGLITAAQFAVVDACMMAVGATRFHFRDPSKHYDYDYRAASASRKDSSSDISELYDLY